VESPGNTIRPLPAGFASRPALLLAKLGDKVPALAEPGLKRLGLTTREYVALAVLDADQPKSQLELGQHLGLGGQVIVTLADELESKGLIARRRSSDDRRRMVIVLTAAGSRALAEADALGSQVEENLLAPLSEDERPVFREMISRVLQSAGIPPCDTPGGIA
jgi:MarR family transcriptional regulator, lower aerobic nicotinate degradation pathway regulator